MRKKTKMVFVSMVAVLVLGGCSGTDVKTEKRVVSNTHTASEADLPAKIGNMDRKETEERIKAAQDLMENQAAKLWGKKLNSRILVFDEETREFIASENSADNNWKKIGDVYTGVIPEEIPLANSTIQFGGKSWATVEYSGFEDKKQALEVYVHEMFHNNQALLGHCIDKYSEEIQEEYEGYNNSHMDEMDARILLKMEWTALHKAFHCEGGEQKKAIEAALTFRKRRQDKYDSKKDESCFELEEGLADYTCLKVVYENKGELSKVIKREWERVLDEERVPSLVRSFGYHSGLLYGLLLDESGEEWRDSIRIGSDLGDELKKAWKIRQIGTDIDAIKYDYGYKDIHAYEKERQEKKEQEEKQLIKKYTEETTITLPLKEWEMEMNPKEITPLKDYGSLYKYAAFYEEWGVIRSEEAGLLETADDSRLIVPAAKIKISGNAITGEGWQLDLSNGYRLEKEKDGNYMVTK